MKEQKNIDWRIHPDENGYLAVLTRDLFVIEVVNTGKRLPWHLKFYLDDNERFILFGRSYGSFKKAEDKANEIAKSLELI